MTIKRLEAILAYLRRGYDLQSAPDSWVRFPDGVGIIPETQAQWLLQHDYLIYRGQDSHNFAMWGANPRIWETVNER